MTRFKVRAAGLEGAESPLGARRAGWRPTPGSRQTGGRCRQMGRKR